MTLSRLRHLARVNPPPSLIKHLPGDTTVSFVPMEDVGEWGGLKLERTKELAEIGTGYTYFENGDVVVAKITPCFENGKGALARDLVSGVGFGTSELHVIRPAPSLDSRFLFYLTISPEFRKLGEAEMYGAGGQKRVPTGFVADFPIPAISLEVQRSIADFLDRKTAVIDELIRKKERLIELLQEKRQALITQAVTKGLDPNVPMKDSGIEWLGEIPAHWQLAPVYSRYDVQLGKMLDAEAAAAPDRVPYLRNANVRWDRIDTSDVNEMEFSPRERVKFRLRRGDLLTCEGGANIKVVGRTAVWQDELPECYYQKALHRLRPTRHDEQPRYFMYVMQMAVRLGVFIADANPNTVFHLTAEKLRARRLPFPSGTEQSEIVSALDDGLRHLDQTSSTLRRQRLALVEYRQALISAAVTGQLDIPPEPTP